MRGQCRCVESGQPGESCHRTQSQGRIICKTLGRKDSAIYLFIFIFRSFIDHFTAKYDPLQRRDSRKFSQDQKAGLSYELNNDTKVYQQKKSLNNSTVISVNNSKYNMYPAFSLNCIIFWGNFNIGTRYIPIWLLFINTYFFHTIPIPLFPFGMF